MPRPAAQRGAARPRGRTTRRDWFSNEPGAWAIVLMPALSAFFVCGPSWTSLWLLVLWACCYCVQFTAARWFKSRFRTRYLPPMLTYAGILAVAGIPFVIMHAGVLRWAPLYLFLVAGSMLGSWLRREHSLWANACAVIASAAMPFVMQPYGSLASPSMRRIGDEPPTAHTWCSPDAFAQPAVTLACAYLVMLGGSVLFVKTMIREHGDRTYLAASWIWHIGVCAAGFAVGPWLGVAATLLLARAVALPLVARTRKVPAATTGKTESVTSMLCFLIITCAV